MHSTEAMLRELLADEEKAIMQYVKIAEKIDNEEMKIVLTNIAEEEKAHKGELVRLLKEIGVHDKFAMKKGEKEVDELLMKRRLQKVQDMLNDMAFKHGVTPDRVVVIPQTEEEAENAGILPKVEEPEK